MAYLQNEFDKKYGYQFCKFCGYITDLDPKHHDIYKICSNCGHYLDGAIKLYTTTDNLQPVICTNCKMIAGYRDASMKLTFDEIVIVMNDTEIACFTSDNLYDTGIQCRHCGTIFKED